ncbi:MAG: sodium-dependent transporter, partial [Thiotrichaceae bacterium]|nr:sodium-dependent transporter [Thiotrichaceae bacterium]
MSDSQAPDSNIKGGGHREQWSSRITFILAATGSAVGLGNIWKFPYITGENGGGAFVLIYLFCIAAIGIPIMMAEIMLGRRGGRDPVTTMKRLAKESGHSSAWGVLGWLGVLAGFLILSYYSVIAGWALAYVPMMSVGSFAGLNADAVNTVFSDLVSDPLLLMFWHSFFIMMTMFVVARGVRGGLEKAVTFLMPLLFVLLVILIFYAIGTGAFQQGLAYLFSPDFSKITTEGVLSAMGHAFFTLSL